jgi:2-polyprenyl-3-methyl-5-hydroxy-6-metoxy-1,4-benzoquinol methylase
MSTVEERLQSGREELNAIFKRLDEFDVAVRAGRALEVTCGHERLTPALAERFEAADVVDGRNPDLGRFAAGSFDFLLALNVLPHLEPPHIRTQLREFMRVLRPGGVAFFNVAETHLYGLALPDAAKRAAIQLVAPPTQLAPGQILPIDIRVRNDSPVPWALSARVQVGNHWRGPDGTVVSFDDGRAVIDRDLGPGETTEVTLPVKAPAEPGGYQLELDLLQERLGWFAEAGSPTLTIPVTVEPVGPGEPGESGAANAATNETELHTLASAEVVAEVEGAGGLVLEIVPEDRCGPLIACVDYVVARSLSEMPTWPREPPHPTGADHEGDPLAVAFDAARSEQLVERVGEVATAERGSWEASARRRELFSLAHQRTELLRFSLTADRGAVGRPFLFVRRVLRRLMAQVLDRQTEFNRSLLAIADDLSLRVTVATREVEVQRETIARAQARIEALERERIEARARNLDLARGLARAELRLAMRRHGERSAETTEIDYLGLAEQFRGTRAEILDRQRKYVHHFADQVNVVDIGCGRGEFLELLRDAGVSATGVDLDEQMVAQCRTLGFEVVHDDGIAYLDAQPESSLGGIFAAQVIEHLRTEELTRLVRLAYSRLRPGGVAVLETLNPACLLATTTFTLDFTHLRMVHPLALQWLAQSVGFEADIEYVTPVGEERKLRPLPGSSGLSADQLEAFNRGIASANDLLFGFQEYAVVARKPS